MDEAFRDKNVLVCGGGGFVGSALCRLLLDTSCRRVLVIDSFLHGTRLHLPENFERLEIVEMNMVDGIALRRFFAEESIDIIFNCVGDTFVPDAYKDPSRFFDNNVRAYLNLLDVVRGVGGVETIIHVSSTEVYGDVETSGRIDENTRLAPVNTYAVTKLAADRLSFTTAIEHGLPIVIARIFNCYGPRETHPYVVPEVFRQLHRGGPLRLGNVEAVRDFTWVYDTARALMALAASGVEPGTSINIGSGNGLTIKELCTMAAEAAGKAVPDIELDERRLRVRDIDYFVCDNARLKKLTGWEPRVGLEEGLSKTWDWYRRHDYRWSWQS